MEPRSDVDQLLEVAEEFFYERGYQSVGMDALRAASGLSLKRIYSLFPGKKAIAVAMLDRRDERWHASLAEQVSQEALPERRVDALFDWLSSWLSSEGHRGCAWINAFGELGGTVPDIASAVRRHKTRLRNYVVEISAEAGVPQAAADGIFLLVEGCMVTAGIAGNANAAAQAKEAAVKLMAT